MFNSNKKIVIALSGGIDSAVAAYLVKQQNPDKQFSAVFMQNWDNFVGGNISSQQKCTQMQDWKDAKQVAEFLKITIRKKEFIAEYWDEVFTKFITQLQEGLTPNPDIGCNSMIKFSHFTSYAGEQLAADLVVTGHYASIIYNQEKDVHYLAKCNDPSKDQTYFLCQIKRSILPYLAFPLSELTKQEVKKKASLIGLPNVQRKESMGICFIGESNFSKFISNYLPSKTGDLVDIETLAVIGKHSGAVFLTIGQRKGLGLSGYHLPYYVVGKDVESNIVYIAEKSKTFWLYSSFCIVKEFNWLVPSIEIATLTIQQVTAKFRHRQQEVAVDVDILSEDNKNLKINCHQPVKSLTPGQFAVLYRGNLCLGGGIINSTQLVDGHSKPHFLSKNRV